MPNKSHMIQIKTSLELVIPIFWLSRISTKESFHGKSPVQIELLKKSQIIDLQINGFLKRKYSKEQLYVFYLFLSQT